MKIAKSISIALIFIALFFFFNLFHKKENVVSFTKNNTTIYLEIANTEKQREYGLMNRKSMPNNHGMVFIFPKTEILKFWMKNTLIPLDMIFLNHHKIVAIISNVLPCPKETNYCPSYGPDIPADEAIELNARMADKLQLVKNETVMLKENLKLTPHSRQHDSKAVS